MAHRSWVRIRWPLLVVLCLAACGAACGARTALEVDSPDASPSDAPMEVCNGIDEDGDGRIDEGLPGVECGVGACLRTACDGMCVPGEPSAEACGGGDEDCDGVVDEGLLIGALGPVAEVREGAGGYDRCGTCSWAYAPILVPLDDGGVYVHWNHGIYGGEEIPNMWGRVLDASGRTVGEPQPIGDRVRLGAVRIPGLDFRDGLVMAVERVRADDVGRLWRFTPGGLEQVDADFGRCSRATSLAYVGDRLVTACMERGRAELRTQRIGERGTTVTLEVDDLFYGGVLHPHAIDGEILLAAYNVDVDRDERWMSFARFSPSLDELQPLTRTEAAYTLGQPAFAVPGGWIWWNLHSWPDAVSGERLDRGGALLGPTEPYPFRAANPPLAYIPLGGGHHLVVIPATDFDEPLFLVRLDERGGVVQQLPVEVPPNPAGEPDFTGHIDLIEHRGEYWVTWVGSYPADGEPNHVNVQRFGCVAP